MASKPVVMVGPPARPVDSDVTVPGSKSLTNRALLVAAAAEGESVLQGVLQSEDTLWCLDALRRLGVAVEEEPGHRVRVRGCAGRWPVGHGELFLGSAGTLARFLPGLLAAAPAGEWRLAGSEQLSRRPVAPLVDALQALGGRVEYAGPPGRLPLRVRAGGLGGGRVGISGSVSSQFASGLLLAAPYAREPVEVEVIDDLVQPEYVRMTVALMQEFGAHVEAAENLRRFRVLPGAYRGGHHRLEADASTAGYLLALAVATGGRLRVSNVGYRSLQPDARFVDVLEQLGCRVVRGDSFLEVAAPAGDPGRLREAGPAGGSAMGPADRHGTAPARTPPRLRGGFRVDMKPMSDQALALGALAVLADAPVEVAGVAHIRQHESDRIGVFCANLRRLGIRADERADGFTVYPPSAPPDLPQEPLDPHQDHRQAMALSVIAAALGPLAIADPGCVAKTCPTFFEDIRQLGIAVAYR